MKYLFFDICFLSVMLLDCVALLCLTRVSLRSSGSLSTPDCPALLLESLYYGFCLCTQINYILFNCWNSELSTYPVIETAPTSFRPKFPNTGSNLSFKMIGFWQSSFFDLPKMCWRDNIWTSLLLFPIFLRKSCYVWNTITFKFLTVTILDLILICQYS